jgi:hypothetical protein
MSFLLTRIKVDDYDAWKSTFDTDPVGARAAATGHRILRGVADPNEVFIRVSFPSSDDASAARERLLTAGILDRVNVQSGPTVAEAADAVEY